MRPIKLKDADLKLEKRADGKTVLSVDHKAKQAKKPVCARGGNPNKIRYGKRAAANVNRTP
jgi:hypothetical protein